MHREYDLIMLCYTRSHAVQVDGNIILITVKLRGIGAYIVQVMDANKFLSYLAIDDTIVRVSLNFEVESSLFCTLFSLSLRL